MQENFETTVIQWFLANQRILPWRATTDPYKIWVSEIMLQQTQVIRVIDYYHRFLEQFPTVTALAKAEQAQLLKVWEGLGYYSRVRNMQAAASLIVTHHQGEFPKTYPEILALPGIGSYTAGAICACAYGLAHPAVDGNVLRIMSRLGADFQDISKAKTKTYWETQLAVVMTNKNPSAFNQGLIELGALICTPTNPKCDQCPLREQCRALKQECQDQLPVKARKKPAQLYYYETFLFVQKNSVQIVENKKQAVLQHLWSLPQIEVENQQQDAQLIQELVQKTYRISATPTLFGEYKHIFSHQIWQMRVWIVEVEQKSQRIGGEQVDSHAFQRFPMANSHRKILEAYWQGLTAEQCVAEEKSRY